MDKHITMDFTNTNDIEICEHAHSHQDAVQSAQSQLPSDELLFDLAELFKIFGDSTRIKILYILFENEMCVCDIASLVGVSQSAVSHQLRLLKQANLIKPRRDGKTVFYSLADNHVKTIISNGMNHILEKHSFNDNHITESSQEALIRSIISSI